MSYGTKYIMGFDNELNEFYEIYLDFLNYAGSPSNILGALQALTVRSTTGDQNKMEPIIGTELLMEIFVGKASVRGKVVDDSALTIESLIAQHDNDIRVTIYRNRDYTKIIYQGFVVVEDNYQPFADSPFILNIRALDGLGLLKNVDMVDTNGSLYGGNLSIRDWLGNILYKTGQTLNLRCYFPFYPIDANSTLPSLAQVYLNAITWQQGEIVTSTDPSIDVAAGEADDAYTALEKICRCLRCRLFQEDGVWNFISLYTYIDPNGITYDESAGTLVSGYYQMATVATSMGVNLDINIGHDQIHHPVNADQMRYLKLATKFVKLTYTYDQSVNKICNQNFVQGNRNPIYDRTIGDEIVDPNFDPNSSNTLLVDNGYDLFCWTHMESVISGTDVLSIASPSAPTQPAWIQEVLDPYGTIVLRSVVIAVNGGSMSAWIKSGTFLIDAGDRITISFDYRFLNGNINFTHLFQPLAALVMLGTDGKTYSLYQIDGPGLTNPNDPNNFKWYEVDPVTLKDSGGVQRFIQYAPFSFTEYQFWISVGLGIQHGGIVPFSGTCTLYLFAINRDSSYNEAWIKNISITILPYFMGSYVQLKGDYNFSSSNNTIKQTISEDVQISDSPKRYFKGALIKQNGDLWVPQWHRIGVLESLRFQRLMERVYFNNVYRIFEKIEGTFRGLLYTYGPTLIPRQAGYLNRYFFSDHTTPTKKFILTSFDNDYATGQGRRVFVEILDDVNDTGWVAPDNYVFQYLFQ